MRRPTPDTPNAPEGPRPRRSTRTDRRTAATIPATVALTLLSVVTAIGFCRIFNGWSFLPAMLVVVIGTHVCAFVLRVVGTPIAVAAPMGLMVLFMLIAWKYYPSTLSGPLPTSRTIDQLLGDLRLARDQFPSAVAPVASVGGFVVLATASTALGGLLADAFAFRAFGRVEAAVPSAVMFIFASALAADRNRVAVTAAWLGCALALVAILRVTHSEAEHSWIGSRARVLASVLPVAIVLAGCAAAGGAWLGPRLPGAGEESLVDTRNRDDVTQVLSPLVDIRSRLVNLSNVELFTVLANEPDYWRATGLSRFDGSSWRLPNNELDDVSGSFEGAPPSSHLVTQQIHIVGLGGNLLPAAYSPVRLDEGRASWVSDTSTLVIPGVGLRRASNFTVVSAVLDIVVADLSNATSVAPPDSSLTDLPGNFPQSVAQTAQEVTAGESTVYGKALALQNWFQKEFVYDLAVQRGHGNDALENFLRTRHGYCEQFSGAFAAMARSLGVPARVAVGFTQGELGTDGRYHVYGRNAHAWPEVWFDNVGWVAFEPTPGRGQPGTEQYTGVAPAQAGGNNPGEGNPDVTTPVESTSTTVAPTTTLPNGTGVVPSTTISSASLGGTRSSGTSALLAVLGLTIATALLWAFALPRIVRRIRTSRTRGTATAQIRGSWLRAADALELVGVARRTDETPLEHAGRALDLLGPDAQSLHELAYLATAAEYGGLGDDETADRCSQLADDIVRVARARLSGTDRCLVWLKPTSAALLLTD